MVDDRKDCGIWFAVSSATQKSGSAAKVMGLDRALLSDSDHNLRNRTRGGVRTLLGGSPLHRRGGPQGPARSLETGF